MVKCILEVLTILRRDEKTIEEDLEKMSILIFIFNLLTINMVKILLNFKLLK